MPARPSHCCGRMANACASPDSCLPTACARHSSWSAAAQSLRPRPDLKMQTFLSAPSERSPPRAASHGVLPSCRPPAAGEAGGANQGPAGAPGPRVPRHHARDAAGAPALEPPPKATGYAPRRAVGGQCVHRSESIIFVERSVADLPQRVHCRDFFWSIHLYSEVDRPFMEAWEAKYGYSWPRIAHNTIHPALARLFYRYLDFELTWSGHAGDQALGLLRPPGGRIDCALPLSI